MKNPRTVIARRDWRSRVARLLRSRILSTLLSRSRENGSSLYAAPSIHQTIEIEIIAASAETERDRERERERERSVFVTPRENSRRIMGRLTTPSRICPRDLSGRSDCAKRVKWRGIIASGNRSLALRIKAERFVERSRWRLISSNREKATANGESSRPSSSTLLSILIRHLHNRHLQAASFGSSPERAVGEIATLSAKREFMPKFPNEVFERETSSTSRDS